MSEFWWDGKEWRPYGKEPFPVWGIAACMVLCAVVAMAVIVLHLAATVQGTGHPETTTPAIYSMTEPSPEP